MLLLDNKNLINHLFTFLHVWDNFFNIIKIIFGRDNLEDIEQKWDNLLKEFFSIKPGSSWF